MNNTFWTIIENNYYRIHNGVLKYAPINNIDNSVIADNEANIEVISIDMLELINNEFGSNFIMDDFR